MVVKKALGRLPICSRPASAALFLRSAAPGVRSLACTCGRRATRSMSLHGYVIPAREALDFSGLVHRVNAETLSQIEVVADARRPLLSYAALVLEHLVRIARPKDVVISRSGYARACLYSLLKEEERRKDPLIAPPPPSSICCARARPPTARS